MAALGPGQWPVWQVLGLGLASIQWPVLTSAELCPPEPGPCGVSRWEPHRACSNRPGRECRTCAGDRRTGLPQVD